MQRGAVHGAETYYCRCNIRSKYESAGAGHVSDSGQWGIPMSSYSIVTATWHIRESYEMMWCDVIWELEQEEESAMKHNGAVSVWHEDNT